MTANLSVERHKDADSTGTWGFRLVKSNSSLVPHVDGAVNPTSRPKLSSQTRAALNALDDAIKEHGERREGEKWPSNKVVSVERWKEYCERHEITNSDKPDSMKKAFQRVQRKLREDKLISILDGYVWRRFENQTVGTDKDKHRTSPEMSRDREGGTDRDTPL